MTKEQKQELLKNSNFLERLTALEILKVFLWDLFNRKKMNKFYENLNDGKDVKFAIKDVD